MLGVLVAVALPGVLEVVGHMWASTTLRVLEQRSNHPRLLGVAQVWAGVLMPGWFSAMMLLHSLDPLFHVTYAVLVVSLGPLFAISLFDRRR